MWLSYFLRWWRQELAELIPDWISVAFFGGNSAKRLHFSEKSKEITHDSAHVTAPLSLLNDGAPITPRTKKHYVVDVVLPDNLALARRIDAPRQARGKLKSLAALDLRRNTPFTEQNSVWSLGRIKSEGQAVSAVQYVAKPAELKALRRRLEEVGLVTRKLLVEDEDAADVALQDFTDSLNPNTKKWRWVNASLVCIFIAVGLFTFLKPAFEAKARYTELQQDLTSLRAETVALRQRVDEMKSQRDEEARFRAFLRLRPRLVESVRNVTVALSDDAWVSSMTFTPETITLSGETSEAAVDIVLELSQNRNFGDPRLSGATTLTRDGREKFEISASPGPNQ